ncbi:hypothetical protein HMPREF9072_02285 [Capnocytophaga sp. oral taxon 324 str. F0483]|nr:hypothetical protein HMPREF9072_02285 [Capnocytophaga sp. oral taxon 324 str. F0483]
MVLLVFLVLLAFTSFPNFLILSFSNSLISSFSLNYFKLKILFSYSLHNSKKESTFVAVNNP